MSKRDAKGRFVKGTKAGPGRPKKKPVNMQNAPPLWSYALLRQAWLVFKVANKYDELEILRCPCGNSDPSQFDYKLDTKGGKLRCHCKRCGRWLDFLEKPTWYIAQQRKGTVEWMGMP